MICVKAASPQSNNNTVPFEENYKKAVTELLVLQLLSGRDCYIGELTEEIRKRSSGALQIVFPYAAIYRMLEREQIEEVKKRTAPDGRRRQYFHITPVGREYLDYLRASFLRLSEGVSAILSEESERSDNNE